MIDKVVLNKFDLVNGSVEVDFVLSFFELIFFYGVVGIILMEYDECFVKE